MSHHPGTHAAGGGGGKISGGKMRSPTKKKVETLAAFHRVAKRL